MGSLVNFRFGETPYLTLSERQVFGTLRTAGQVSWFRCGTCSACGAEVPKGKQWCSWDCMEWEAMSETIWTTLEKLQGERITVETTDGCYRHGVLTGISWSHVNVTGRDLRSPTAIALDNEPGDELPWNRLKQVSLAG